MTRQKEPNKLSDRISKACEGLTFVSETDSEVVPVFVGKIKDISANAFRHAVTASESTLVTEASTEEFFSRLINVKPWHTPQQKKNAKGFARLAELLSEELDDLRVFRLGRVRIDIYVVGRDSVGNWQGIKTYAVET